MYKEDWPSYYDTIVADISSKKLNDFVINLGKIPQEEIFVLNTYSDILIYPSMCESFGFSMIEALGYGLPIVAADTPINREICGDAAIYYSPLNAEECANAIFSALDEKKRIDLKNKGIERFNSFDWSWKRYTKEFKKILSEISTINN